MDWKRQDGICPFKTGKNVRALIQTGYLEDENTTTQYMLQALENTYNDSVGRLCEARTQDRTRSTARTTNPEP